MMLRSKGSKSESKKGEAEQKRQGVQERGEIPPVPKSPDSGPPAIKSEGACGRSSMAEDSEHLKHSQYNDSEDRADGASGGHRKTRRREQMGLKKLKEKDKKKHDKDKKDKREKGWKRNIRQYEKEPQERTRSASQLEHSDKRTSQSSQHPLSLSEAPPPPQRHHTHSESSQGSHVHANSQDTAIEEGAKQASPEAQGDDIQMEIADDAPVFVEPQLGQMTASKSQQDEKGRIIAELAKELEETKSTRIQKLETEIQLLQTKETEMHSQYQEHVKDLRVAVQRKQDEIDKLSDKHATEVQAMKDNHSKTIAEFHQERKQSEKEKDEEARKLKQSLQEQEVLYQESEEKIKLLRRESIQLKEELETKLKEQKEQAKELCALPANHHLKEMRREKGEREREHAIELSQLQADLNEKERKEEKCNREADKLRQELKAAKENHAKDVEELRELKQENVRVADELRQELKDAEKKHANEIRLLQAALKEKDEQEETNVHFKLDEFATKHADEIQRLKAELKEKDEQCTKAIEDIRAEYEEKHKTEEHQKKTEVEAKVMRHNTVANSVLREKKKEIETLTKNCEEKDATIAGLTKELEKAKEASQQKDLETGKHVQETKAEVEKLQHELRRQHLAEVSKKQKEHDQQLEIKKKDIESLRKQLHQLSATLEGEKETPETVQRLTKELQEKDCELNGVVTEIRTLRGSYEKLLADHEHLQHRYEQLTVEVKMKKELSETWSREFYSSSDPCDTTVMESQDQPASDDGTTCNDEEKDFQSASESSFQEREEEESVPSDMERMTLLQRAATAEEGAKQAEKDIQKLSEEKVALETKLETMNEQLQKLEVWHKIMIDDAEQMPTSEATPGMSQEETVVVNREKQKQLKKNFLLVTEKNMKMERSLQQLLEKLEDRDKQIKELHLNARGNSVVPKVGSLSSEEVAESTEELSHDEALREIQKQNAIISEQRNRIASLQTKMGTFEKTAAENSKMEQHGKEQSKVVMEWRQKYEAAERKVKEHEDELQILRGDVNREKQDSITVQAVQSECERQIEAVYSAMSILEIDKAKLTLRCTAQMHTCKHLQQENEHLLQKLQELEREHNRLMVVYGTVTQQLSQLHKYMGEINALKKQAAVISEAMTAKTVEAMNLKEEKDSIKSMLDEIALELERQKVQVETYKEDFENERNDREAQASTYEEEKAAMSVQHQKIVDDLKQQIEELKIKVGLKEATMKGECAKLEEQIQDLNGELVKAQEQSEQDKDALQIAVTEKQSLEEIHSKLEDKYQEKEAHLEKALAHKSDLEDHLQKSRETMKGECAKLEVQIQTLNAELRKVQEQSEQDKDALQIALAEKQSLEEIHSKLDNKYQEKEAHLEKALAHKSDLEDQLQKSRANHKHEVNEMQEQLQQLQSESTELQQQISKANEEIAAWRGDCQAKTQQVKQYSKQVEQFRAQVDCLTTGLRDSRAKIAEYEHQLGYYQEQAKQLEEDNERKTNQALLQYGKAVSHLESQLQWVNNEALKFSSQVAKENDLLPFIPACVNAPPKAIANIGRGAYGSVDLVKISGVECAAKTIYNALVGRNVSSAQRRPMQDKFQQECITICRMRHPNVVQFMGVYCNDHQSLDLVLFMEHLPIDLHTCLEEAKKRNYNIPNPTKLSILIDICQGLSHIHSFLLLHRDLTAKNVLLTHHVRAKISDFGNSKLYDQSQKLSKAPGNVAYMPPEAKTETPHYDTALDVFSFGVLTLFVSIQEFPELPMNLYLSDIPRNVRDRGEEEVFIRDQWISKLDKGYSLLPLIYHCLRRDPSKRPKVNQLQENYLGRLNSKLSMETVAKAHTEMLLYFNKVLS